MRDIVLAIILSVCFFHSLRNAFVGFMTWEWLSLMNPHRMAYGFTVNAPLAQISMICLLIGLLSERNKGKLFQHGIVVLQIVFLVWTGMTTMTAIFPETSVEGLVKFAKIMFGVLLTYGVINSRERLEPLVWLIFFSIGFYGIKGGIFTLVTGGNHKVMGPDGTFIGDNNTMAVALLMVIPLGFYLTTITSHNMLRVGLFVSMALMGVSVLGSSSRGALVGMLAMGLFWMQKVPGKQKIIALLVAVFIGAVALAFMPQSYWDRMNTIKTYQQDASAMGRINAWWCAFNLASDRFMGAGFDYASPYAFKLYAPNPADLHTAHSIYFQVLGDHGFVGLFLFLAVLLWTWLLLSAIARKTRHRPDLMWANNMARMTQLGLIAYMSAGAFLSLPYYDLYWQVVTNTVILHSLVLKSLAEGDQVVAGAEGAPAAGQKEGKKIQPFVRPCRTRP